jgi:hypothetical protein
VIKLEKIEPGRKWVRQALEIVETKPLYLRVSFVGQTDSGGITQYSFRIQREAAARASDRAPMTRAFTRVGRSECGIAPARDASAGAADGVCVGIAR